MSTVAPSRPRSGNALERFFHIGERGSTIGREVRGGLVTFFTMAYIIVLNPIILSSGKDATGQVLAGGDQAQIAAATALVAGVVTILMGWSPTTHSRWQPASGSTRSLRSPSHRR